MFIPKGFAHGFLTLTDYTEIQYKVDEYYAPEYDRSIRFDDPEIGIEWGIEDSILAEKDRKAPFLKDSDASFGIRVVVTGAEGQLGSDVVERLKALGFEAIGVSRREFDITDEDQTKAFFSRLKPDVILHCAAYTDVDRAEDEKEACYDVNVRGTKHIAEAAKQVDAKMVYISTDYVFSSVGDVPHFEDEATKPVNYYGATKEQGEKIVRELLDEHFIIRTSWVYGLHGNNFVKSMLKLAESHNEINVVNDQIGAPTFTKDLAFLISELIQTNHYGTYHGVNEGWCSWYEFAKEIFSLAEIDIKVNPVATADDPTKAVRPLNSRLSKLNLENVGLDKLPDWKDAFSRFLNDINYQEDK